MSAPFNRREFIIAWQRSGSVSEVCNRLQVEDTRARRMYLSTLAWNYRQQGVPLKLMDRGRRFEGWAALAQLAKAEGGEE